MQLVELLKHVLHPLSHDLQVELLRNLPGLHLVQFNTEFLHHKQISTQVSQIRYNLYSQYYFGHFNKHFSARRYLPLGHLVHEIAEVLHSVQFPEHLSRVFVALLYQKPYG